MSEQFSTYALDPVPAPKKTNLPAIISLVCVIPGILSLCGGLITRGGAGFIGISVLSAIGGLIIGWIGLGQITKNGEKGKGMAIAGIVIAGITLTIWVFMAVIVFIILGPVYGSMFR